ncbi:hypothetical protein M3Y99_01936700 [Aphelenchoides fujianensis]|nr:hypothetical protein M3Y99_01936700 [Aphelenchoides fujianensis]
MIDAFANTTDQLPLLEVPFEMKAVVDEGMHHWLECVRHIGNKSRGFDGYEGLFYALRRCAIEKKHEHLALWSNVNLMAFDLRWHRDKALDCYLKMTDGKTTGELFYLLDAKRLCRTVQFMSVPYCTMREMCGRSKTLDVVYATQYALFQLKANGFIQAAEKGDCPISSSDIGRSLNPKLFTQRYFVFQDEVFVRDYAFYKILL